MLDAVKSERADSSPDGHGDAREPSDGELLARFISRQERASFEALVLRHKSMVMGVCRRVLRDEHAAEDAFQATFMVLLRRATSIGRPELLANWLYGVAFRVARKARIKAARERASESCADVVAPAEPRTGPEWSETRTALDEELNQLPAKHRLPLVLCYLNGKTNLEAARLLGCPAGSIANRLSVARAELRRRLERRGMVVPAALVALLLRESSASAAVSELLLGSTLNAIDSPLQRGDAEEPGSATDTPSGQAEISGTATRDPLDEPVIAAANNRGKPKPLRRRFRKLSKACLWLLLFSWIAFPIHDLVGASRVRSEALQARGARQAGHRTAGHSRVGTLIVAWISDRQSTVSLSDADDRDADDERCKRCLGTNCGYDDSVASAPQASSFWTFVFGQ
jgi:RNA polymerase sigma factor (sigma-70 family)